MVAFFDQESEAALSESGPATVSDVGSESCSVASHTSWNQANAMALQARLEDEQVHHRYMYGRAQKEQNAAA